MRFASISLAVIVLFNVSACQKLNIDKTVQVNSGDVKYVSFDSPRSEQKVAITISSPGTPVTAYLVLEKDLDAEMKRLTDGKSPAAAIAKGERVESATLEGTIPAKEGFAVLLQHNSSKTVEVNVKATSK